MSVFMYNPGIKIYISTASNGVIDVSEDVTQGSLVRRSSGVSTFSFILQNARRKYDGVFTPNDRIIVMMKRLAWMRVMTGYLNAVPLVTAWPMAIQMTASCSLKRLQYWYWDPGLASSQNMVNQALASVKAADDGGTANAVLAILNNVVGWPNANVHIAGIPQKWMTWAYKIAKDVSAELAQADALAQQFYAELASNGTVGGVLQGGMVSSGALKAGTYGNIQLTDAQAQIAVTIYNTGVSLGATAHDQVVAIAVAYQESKLGANQGTPGTTGGSVGIFQQTPQNGWGTAAQLANPTYAATQFFKALLKVANRNSMSIGQAGQAVQRSGAGGAYYQQWATAATQIVNILVGGGGSSTAPALSTPSSTTTGKATGAAFLQTALNLVQAYPHIPYQEGGDSPPQTPANQVTLLDCSSFVQWVYYHTLGSLGQCPRTSQLQSAWCKSNGTILSAAQGMKIKGALMFMGQPGSATHVEMSVGDGVHTVGSHHSGTYAGVVSSAGYWTCAGLLPAIDFSAAGGGASSSASSAGSSGAGSVQLNPASSQPWYNASDPFDALFGSQPWVGGFEDPSQFIGSQLSGPRALLADQPMLPYLKNMLSSTMRSFSSAPNGDFIAWFPDYYGIWGTAAIMQIEPIELQDFSVWWDDSQLVTHQYTVAPYSQNQLDLATGQVGSTTPSNITELNLLTTSGVATIDIPAIMYALFGLEPTQAQAQKFIAWVYQRFGARPNFQQMPGVIGPQGEFFSALFLFMQSWAYQYNADIPVTFMPELWPGMLVQIPSFGFQAYVTTVTHEFQMGPGGGFSTSINIAAPARLPGTDGNSSGNLIGMPLAGGLIAPQGTIPGQGTG